MRERKFLCSNRKIKILFKIVIYMYVCQIFNRQMKYWQKQQFFRFLVFQVMLVDLIVG